MRWLLLLLACSGCMANIANPGLVWSEFNTQNNFPGPVAYACNVGVPPTLRHRKIYVAQCTQPGQPNNFLWIGTLHFKSNGVDIMTLPLGNAPFLIPGGTQVDVLLPSVSLTQIGSASQGNSLNGMQDQIHNFSPDAIVLTSKTKFITLNSQDVFNIIVYPYNMDIECDTISVSIENAVNTFPRIWLGIASSQP